MSKQVYVVEYSDEEKEFNSREDAEREALEFLGMGYAVRMYIREV
jgi:hypothetical protein